MSEDLTTLRTHVFWQIHIREKEKDFCNQKSRDTVPFKNVENLFSTYVKSATGHKKSATGHEKSATGHEKSATGHEKIATGHEKSATGHEKSATGHEKSAIGHEQSTLHSPLDVAL